MIYRNAIMLVTLAVSSNAFWWGNEREIEHQPVKPVPVGYFRTFTYQPLPFNPQTPNQYLSYPDGKMLQPNLYNWQKSFPPQSSLYGKMPAHNIPQPVNTQNMPTPITPTNTAPVSSLSTQSQQSTSHSSQTATHTANSNPTMATSATSQSQQINDVQPPTTAPAQFTSNLVNNLPIRHLPYVPDPVNLQYITNVAPLPLQQVQFVPCMCPVAVSISTAISPEAVANKRSDEIPISDYRESPIVEQSIGLSEER